MTVPELLQFLDDAHRVLADETSMPSFAARRTLEWIGTKVRAEGVSGPPAARPVAALPPGKGSAPWEGESRWPQDGRRKGGSGWACNLG